MKCHICDAPRDADAAYCAKCGTKLRPVQAEEEDAAVKSLGDQDTADPMGALTPSYDQPGKTPLDQFAAAARNQTEGDSRELGKHDLWTGRYAKRAIAGHTVAIGLLTIALIIAATRVDSSTVRALVIGTIAIIWIGLGVLLMYRRLNNYYRLTELYFYHDSGVLRRTSDRIEVIDIDDVAYEQGIIDRMGAIVETCVLGGEEKVAYPADVYHHLSGPTRAPGVRHESVY